MPIRADEVLASENANRARARLQEAATSDPVARSVLRRLDSLRTMISNDILHGEVVRKPLPKDLVARYGADNLYVEDLPGFWRLIYTITRDQSRRRVVVLEIVDHATYDTWFPGRGR